MALDESTQSPREFLAEYLDTELGDVSPDRVDDVIRFVRDNFGGDAEVDGAVVLDAQARAATREYLEARERGEILDPGESAIDPWDEFVKWARKFFEAPDFDEAERDYKLVIGQKISAARVEVRANSEEWQQLLRKAFGAPNNLTYFITHSRFLDWTQAEPAAAREALIGLWDENVQLDDRVQTFCDRLPSEIATPGSRLEIASFLLMADPLQYPMYRPTPIKTAVALVEFDEIPNEPDAAIYHAARLFLDEFVVKAKERGLELRDRLDAQGLVWALTKSSPEGIDWPHDEVEAFLRYRGDLPSVYWVNQGATYREELEHGLVSASFANRAGIVLQHHKVVSSLRKGDTIVHYADGLIRAISTVTHKPGSAKRPWDPERGVMRVAKVEYFELVDPIAVRSIDAYYRIPEYGPFDRYGGVKQVYMEPLAPELVDYLRREFQSRWPEGSSWEAVRRTTWLFQSNPDLWDLAELLESMDVGDQDTFTVNRYKTEIAPGDRVLMWVSGSESGLYAVGTISGEVFETTEDDDAQFGDTSVPWRLDYKIDPYIPRALFREHEVLRGMSVITAPQASNFKVTDEQWVEIERLLTGKKPATSDGEQPKDVSLEDISVELLNQGLMIADRTLRRFHVSLRTRGFVILSGVSGTGKTWLTEAYAEAIGARYLLVPVAPNWTTNEDLLGYLNPITNAYHDTVFSEFLRKAAVENRSAVEEQREPRKFVLALDEMNLARVEYYFAKFLSAMEIRMRKGTADLELAPNETVELAQNLLFVGTVNVDETTHPFADKVYDRAQLVELDAPRDAIDAHIGSVAFRDPLLEVYDAVADSKPFAFRVVDEFKAYVAESEALDVAWHDSVDEQILQKVLPKLSGADPSIYFALEKLVGLAEEHEFGLTKSKAKRMMDDYNRDGFTSYF